MTADERETLPMDRFDWERCVRRMPIGMDLKGFALLLSTYADSDGTRVRPGNEVLTAVTGLSDSTVRRRLTDLTDLGLLTLVSRGGGRGRGRKASDYRLSIPIDFVVTPGLLSPQEHVVSADDSSVIQVTGQSGLSEPDGDQSPVDNSPLVELHAADPEPLVDRLTGHPRRLTGHPGEHPPTTYTSHPFQPPAIPDKPGHSLARTACGQTNRSPPVAVPAA